MANKEVVYAVMKTPLFKATFKVANLLYGVGNYAYAKKLITAKANLDVVCLSGAFIWLHTKEAPEYWARIDMLESGLWLEAPV